MATEVKLKDGWLLRDVRRAAERLDQWASSRPPHRTEVRQADRGPSERSIGDAGKMEHKKK